MRSWASAFSGREALPRVRVFGREALPSVRVFGREALLRVRVFGREALLRVRVFGREALPSVRVFGREALLRVRGPGYHRFHHHLSTRKISPWKGQSSAFSTNPRRTGFCRI